MNKFFLMIASLFIATSVAYANPIQGSIEYNNGISVQNDLEFAFGNNVKTENVMFMNADQMSEVQGKGWKKRYKRAKKHVKKNKKHYSFAGSVALSVALAPTGVTTAYLATYYVTSVSIAAYNSYGTDGKRLDYYSNW